MYAPRGQCRERPAGNGRDRFFVARHMQPIRMYTTRWCGYTELWRLHRSGHLDEKLAA
jgi:hypothetical protein